MIEKVLSGFEAFDQHYGGFYSGRVALLSGCAGAGKTLFGLKFLEEGARQSEQGLLLSTRPLDEVVHMADALRLPLSRQVAGEQVLLLEYSLPRQGSGSQGQPALPPDGFLQLSAMIEGQGVRRVVLDTVAPWVALPGLERLSEHVLSFVRACDRLGATTLFTLPRPRSPAAMRLRQLIEAIVPVSLSLEVGSPGNEQRLVVHKYLGLPLKEKTMPYTILAGAGLVSGREASAGHERAAVGFAEIMKDRSLVLSR